MSPGKRCANRRTWTEESGQLINVFEDRYLRNNLFTLYFQEVYTVSANVIVFE